MGCARDIRSRSHYKSPDDIPAYQELDESRTWYSNDLHAGVFTETRQDTR